MSQNKPVQITEVALRDGHQSLLATRMRTEDMLPLCSALDAVGYWSLEVWGGATFDSCVRYLKEDPWERLRQLRAALPNTPLQMLLRGQNLLGYRHYADDVVEAFIHKAAENGIDVFRIFDAMNDVRNLDTAIKAVKAAGKHAQGTICYTVSPVHDTASFVKLAKDLQGLGCDSLVIKDMAGLLTPSTTFALVKALKDAVDLPLSLHSHMTAGLGALCQQAAIDAGIDVIDTALSALSGGTSHPATETMVAALADHPRATGLDLAALQPISRQLWQARKRYHQFESEFTREDVGVQINQVPGGMMSNLANQLKEQGALHRIDEVFAEIPRVREDLGFPPLVTPTSQIVGTQAVMNILASERYANITTEVKRYLQGLYGKTPAPVNAELRIKAIGDSPLIEERPADLLAPELEKLRAEIGELAESEEDVLIFAMFPDLAKSFLEQRRAGTLTPEPLEPQVAASADKGAVPTEFVIDVHGESYQVAITGTGIQGGNKRQVYLTLDGMPEEVLIESLNEYTPQAQQGRPRAQGEGHVSTSMPGNIVEVLVAVGDKVEAGQPILVTEAMKMEAEVQAPISGTVSEVLVAKGDRVTPGELLVSIDA